MLRTSRGSGQTECSHVTHNGRSFGQRHTIISQCSHKIIMDYKQIFVILREKIGSTCILITCTRTPMLKIISLPSSLPSFFLYTPSPPLLSCIISHLKLYLSESVWTSAPPFYPLLVILCLSFSLPPAIYSSSQGACLLSPPLAPSVFVSGLAQLLWCLSCLDAQMLSYYSCLQFSVQ